MNGSFLVPTPNFSFCLVVFSLLLLILCDGNFYGLFFMGSGIFWMKWQVEVFEGFPFDSFVFAFSVDITKLKKVLLDFYEFGDSRMKFLFFFFVHQI